MTTTIVAEIGPNHDGSIDVALEMIRRLASTGIDVVKFQLAVPENVYSQDAFKADYQRDRDGTGSPLEMSRRLQLSRTDHRRLYAECARLGVRYACTAFDLESLRFLDDNFDLPFFKIASGELPSLDMLEYIAGRSRAVVLSTGMATLDEIAASLAILERNGPKDVTLLHCVSQYPAPHGDIHLRVMVTLAQRFGRPVGFSDHTLGPECCLAAVALGAVVVEKHVTLDRGRPGPDHAASATIEEMAALVTAIRRIESALGKPDKVFAPAEAGIRRMARKSIVATRDIAHGEVIAGGDIAFKRPGTGLSPMDRDRVIGRRTARPLAIDRIIEPEDLA